LLPPALRTARHAALLLRRRFTYRRLHRRTFTAALPHCLRLLAAARTPHAPALYTCCTLLTDSAAEQSIKTRGKMAAVKSANAKTLASARIELTNSRHQLIGDLT